MRRPSRETSLLSLIAMQFLIAGTYAVMGILSAPFLSDVAAVLALGVLGMVVGVIVPLGLVGALIVLYPRVVRRHGWRSIAGGVMRSFLLLIPYAVLAVIARAILHWEVTGAFAAAGLMTACAGIGAELGRLGGSKLTSMLLPMLTGSALSTMWLSMTSLLTTLLIRGLP